MHVFIVIVCLLFAEYVGRIMEFIELLFPYDIRRFEYLPIMVWIPKHWQRDKGDAIHMNLLSNDRDLIRKIY